MCVIEIKKRTKELKRNHIFMKRVYSKNKRDGQNTGKKAEHQQQTICLEKTQALHQHQDPHPA